jgi:5-methylcytosine-specific restriction endonuclease McrA
MKKINKPENNITTILDNCTAHMNNPRKERVEQVKTTIIEQTTKYDDLALLGQLFTIPEHDNVDSIATKDDMEALYKQKFVPKDESNREFYDKIMLLAPSGKCPYCQQNIANNLDHFLPKTKYVTFSVSPYNLIPSCSDCNTDKSASTFTTYLEQPFHPYYDDFDDCAWLKARLIENEEISFQFYADPPLSVAVDKAERIKNSFSSEGFGLNNIYKVHAPELYRTCFHRIKILFDKGGKDLAIARLLENIEDEQSNNINSWKAAMYQAIIDSNWYWDEYLTNLE